MKEGTRITVECFLVQTLVRVTSSLTISLPIVAQLHDSNLLAAARGDERLLSHGATLLASVVCNGATALKHQGYVVVALLLVAWFVKVSASALLWSALVERRLPFSRKNFLLSLGRLVPFAFLSLTLVTTLAALGIGFFTFLPTVGALLEPSLGDRGTDLTLLGLLGLLGVISAGLVLIGELTRTRLVMDRTSLPDALIAACQDLRYRTLRILAQALPRSIAALCLNTVALYLHLRWQRDPELALAPLAALFVIELAAAATTFLHLDWVLATKRICRSPAANDGASP